MIRLLIVFISGQKGMREVYKEIRDYSCFQNALLQALKGAAPRSCRNGATLTFFPEASVPSMFSWHLSSRPKNLPFQVTVIRG